MKTHNPYFSGDETEIFLNQSFCFDIHDKPFRPLGTLKDFDKIAPDFHSDNFKNTNSFKEFLNKTFDYNILIGFVILFDGKSVIFSDQTILFNQKIQIYKRFKEFFQRNLSMEDEFKEYEKNQEEWRFDVIRSQCNYSFLKQLPRYPADSYWRYEYIHVIS